MSRVLLTGATGFIGSRAVAALIEAGHEVHALARTPGAPTRGLVWHRADLLDDAAGCERIVAELRAERMLHFAWYAEHGRFWSSPENVRWVEASLRLLRAFAAAGGSRAVFAGTCAEYDWSFEICSEDKTPLAPATLYGVTKRATGAVAEALARELGIGVAWGRVFFLYGPGEAPTRLVPTIARSLLAGHEAPTTDGRQVRDFMHVDDVARAFVALLDGDVCGAVNIASGKAVELRELIELVAAATGRPELVRLGALATRPGEPAKLLADVRRLRDEVGFRQQLPLARGIANTVDWWRDVVGRAPDGSNAKRSQSPTQR